MRRLVAALAIAAAAGLAACESGGFTAWATVVEVDEVATLESPAHARDGGAEALLSPEPGWRLELLLDDGSALSVTYNGERRYEPGERVQLVRTPEGRLLL